MAWNDRTPPAQGRVRTRKSLNGKTANRRTESDETDSIRAFSRTDADWNGSGVPNTAAHDAPSALDRDQARPNNDAGPEPTKTDALPADGADYKVGYRKPPIPGQFKPGKSGNPKGRPKLSKNLKTDFDEIASRLMSVRENGQVRKMTTQQVVLHKLFIKAAGGDARAVKQFFELYFKLRHDADTPDEEELTPQEEALLKRMIKND